MSNAYVRAGFDIHCQFDKGAPVYRIYVNDELFVERTWRWPNCYLEEMLKLSAPPGQYRVTVALVSPSKAHLICRNHRVEIGPARWIDANTLEIMT